MPFGSLRWPEFAKSITEHAITRRISGGRADPGLFLAKRWSSASDSVLQLTKPGQRQASPEHSAVEMVIEISFPKFQLLICAKLYLERTQAKDAIWSEIKCSRKQLVKIIQNDQLEHSTS